MTREQLDAALAHGLAAWIVCELRVESSRRPITSTTPPASTGSSPEPRPHRDDASAGRAA